MTTHRLYYPGVPAIQHAHNQSKHGPQFRTGFCLMQTEIAAFGTHGFGGDTASNGWDIAKGRHPIGNKSVNEFLKTVPRGFFLWFKGGSPTEKHPEGAGHIVITGTPFNNWTVDRLRGGFWDRTTVEMILRWNSTHPLRLVGWSEAIGNRFLPYEPHSKDARPR